MANFSLHSRALSNDPWPCLLSLRFHSVAEKRVFTQPRHLLTDMTSWSGEARLWAAILSQRANKYIFICTLLEKINGKTTRWTTTRYKATHSQLPVQVTNRHCTFRLLLVVDWNFFPVTNSHSCPPGKSHIATIAGSTTRVESFSKRHFTEDWIRKTRMRNWIKCRKKQRRRLQDRGM